MFSSQHFVGRRQIAIGPCHLRPKSYFPTFSPSYGAMMWSLSKVVQTPEVMRVYLGSFWVEKPPNSFDDMRELLEVEHRDLLKDLKGLPKNAAIKKINEVVKRARLAKVHALIVGHLKKEMTMFLKDKKQGQLIAELDLEFLKIQKRYHLPPGDFPDVEKFREILKLYKIDEFNSLDEDLIKQADEALANDLPKLMATFPQDNPVIDVSQRNPFNSRNPSFVKVPTNAELRRSYGFAVVDKLTYEPAFKKLTPFLGKVAGAVVRPLLVNTGLSNDVLAEIWRLSDQDSDGYLDIDEFCSVMHLAEAAQSGGQLPETLERMVLPINI
ncbi:hypothetical protein BC938DRAFT_480406 [Jimgerdemannia flammicorona]|uniref:EF-hand domain-containing protein n=1 Tax=Jimgerdemannia flammicorona TaxID=994334 RepID=A0A433QIM9_9FUNG|nr:hypothetical protein BC938DRAFT_480406 [Jimgerdemannia flammicorona]